MSKNMTMLILSCDKFSDLWDGNVKLLEQNWPDRDMETYIVTDASTDKEYRDIKIIAAGTDREWSERLAFALQSVKTDYVFITLDDYFLVEKVNNSSIVALTDMMDEESIDYVRLFKRPKRATREELPGYTGVKRVDITCNYSVNLYSGIWKKEFIEYCVKKPLNAWEFEVSLHKCAEEYGAKCVVSLRNEYNILDVVRKGKLLHKSARYFKRHPGIYGGNREVNSWGYEIRLFVKTFLSRHLPVFLLKVLRKVFSKFGFHFFSYSEGNS